MIPVRFGKNRNICRNISLAVAIDAWRMVDSVRFGSLCCRQVELCQECIDWAKEEKRTFLRQALEVGSSPRVFVFILPGTGFMNLTRNRFHESYQEPVLWILPGTGFMNLTRNRFHESYQEPVSWILPGTGFMNLTWNRFHESYLEPVSWILPGTGFMNLSRNRFRESYQEPVSWIVPGTGFMNRRRLCQLIAQLFWLAV